MAFEKGSRAKNPDVSEADSERGIGEQRLPAGGRSGGPSRLVPKGGGDEHRRAGPGKLFGGHGRRMGASVGLPPGTTSALRNLRGRGSFTDCWRF